MIGSAQVHLSAAIRTEQQAGEHTHVAHLSGTAAALSDFLDDQKHAFLNNRFLCVLKDHPIRRIIPQYFLALERLLGSFEVDRMAQIVKAFQNMHYRLCCPFIRVSWPFRCCRQVVFVAVSNRRKNFIFLEPFCNLRRPHAVHAQCKNLLNNGGSFFIHDPPLLVLRVFLVPIRRDSGEVFAGTSFGLPRCPDFLAGVLGVHFIEYVADGGKLAVPAHTVHTVIDGNKVDAVLWKQHFRIHSDLQIVTPEPAHILNDNALDLARLDVGKHPLESGPVEVGSRISVVLVVVADGCIAVIPAILF